MSDLSLARAHSAAVLSAELRHQDDPLCCSKRHWRVRFPELKTWSASFRAAANPFGLRRLRDARDGPRRLHARHGWFRHARRPQNGRRRERGIADKTLPKGYTVDYGGLSRQFIQESSGFAATFGFALIIIFLALSAQFESFRDPLIILVSAPMSIAGALVFIMLGVKGASLNIYTEVGLITLMGLISKHGILIVEFANELQHAGRPKREAAIEATSIRLRPVLMTTAAMVLGVVPLITGAGAASRFNMGLVIASGLAIGTIFTLFVVPAFYILLTADHSQVIDRDDTLYQLSAGEANPASHAAE
jgi:multidrug efflux pump